jgi:hypothetical protein
MTKLTRQLDILLVHQDLVSLRPKLRPFKLPNRLPRFGQPDELWPVEPGGVIQDTRTIDDRNCLVVGEEDLVWAVSAILIFYETITQAITY